MVSINASKAIVTEAAARRALAVLKDVDWGDTCQSIGIGYCLICEADGHPHEKHEDDCALAAAIRALEAALDARP